MGGWKAQGAILTDDREEIEQKLRAPAEEVCSIGEDSPSQCNSPESAAVESGSEERNIRQGF